MKYKCIAASFTGTGKLNAVIAGKSYTVDATHPNYNKIVESLKAQDADAMVNYIDQSTPIRSFLADQTNVGKVAFKDGLVTYDGLPAHNTITNKVVRYVEQGLPFEPLLRCVERVYENTSNRVVNEIFGFMEFGELAITEDGFILAHKNVGADWFSITGNVNIKPIKGRSNEAGQIFNGVGEIIEIRRNQVDEDSSNTCSAGLHFCSLKYLPNYIERDGGHSVIVKIDPRDICAVPRDYNNTKARCCRYEVVSEYFGNFEAKAKADERGLESEIYTVSNPATPEENFTLTPVAPTVPVGYYSKRNPKTGRFEKTPIVPVIEEEEYEEENCKWCGGQHESDCCED